MDELPAARNFRRSLDDSAWLLIHRKIHEHDRQESEKCERLKISVRVRDPIIAALQLRAPIAVAIRSGRRVVMGGFRDALEQLQSRHVLPGAVGGNRRPQHQEKQGDDLMQPFHGTNRYSTEFVGTTSSSVESCSVGQREQGDRSSCAITVSRIETPA